MFSTSPGDVAQDGSGRNGTFTAALLKYMDSNLKIEDLFKKVTGEVRNASGGARSPGSMSASRAISISFQMPSGRLESPRSTSHGRSAERGACARRGGARAEEAAKTEKALKEAEAGQKAAADALAAKSRRKLKPGRDRARRQSSIRSESPERQSAHRKLRGGNRLVGDELLGEVGPDTPLMGGQPGNGTSRVPLRGRGRGR